MQRTLDGGVIISCDFCGTDWDAPTGQPPMIEGHHGSAICLACVKQALDQACAQEAEYSCPLCLRDKLPTTLHAYRNPARPSAAACLECIHQAARAFSRDPDVDWKWEKK